jgi:ABC-2 type transport system permease protein
MTGAAMARLPSTLVLAAVAVFLVGLLPRAAVAGAWTAVGLAVAIALSGQVLQLSHWMMDISPFTHAPRLPAARCRPPRCSGYASSRSRSPRRPGRPAPP